MLAVFLIEKRVCVMNENTKKDLKDSFENGVIALLCVLFVMSMNNRCSSMMHKATAAKTEKTESQQTNHNIWYKASEKTR